MGFGVKIWTRNELDNLPSLKDGVAKEQEARYRRGVCSLIQDAGMQLGLWAIHVTFLFSIVPFELGCCGSPLQETIWIKVAQCFCMPWPRSLWLFPRSRNCNWTGTEVVSWSMGSQIEWFLRRCVHHRLEEWSAWAQKTENLPAPFWLACLSQTKYMPICFFSCYLYPLRRDACALPLRNFIVTKSLNLGIQGRLPS